MQLPTVNLVKTRMREELKRSGKKRHEPEIAKHTRVLSLGQRETFPNETMNETD